MFELHPQLAKDCALVGDLPLSRVLLLNDCHYPWLVLVPRRENCREIFQLTAEDQAQLLAESSSVASAMNEHFHADKMNIAALGNMVPQLHLHHIVRYKDDPSWPNPVWGAVTPEPYSDKKMEFLLQDLRQLLAINAP